MLVGWKKSLSKCFIIPQRVVMAIMGFFAIVNAYTMRICLSVAIVEMVKKKTSSGNDEHECPAREGSNSVTGGDFEWSQELQGIILSSFYWGYVLTHVPGGILADKFGGKYTLCLGILSTACFTLLTPVVINTAGEDASYYLIALRVLMGIGEGTTFPALSALLSQWTPLKERSKLGAFVFGGAQIGTILGNSVSGLLIDHFKRWDVVFYFFGGLAVIYVILFILLCYSNPDSHPYISDEEKEYLKKELGTLKRDESLPPTPWRAILTNAPMLALVCAQVGHDFGYFIMVTDLPKYMSDVLKFSIKEMGIYSSLPYALMWIVSLLSGVLSDYIQQKGLISVTNSRKLFTSLAAIGPAIFIVAASYAGCDQILVVALFTIAMGIMGAYYAGMKVNCLDLSPNYAGTLMAITNGFAALTGIAGPYIVGVMTPDSSLLQWRTVFWVAFGFFIVTNFVYIFFASGEVQAFNNPVVANQSIEEVQDKVVATYDKEIDDFKIK